ncbi:hypothetical protein Pint_20373 [Pistacia integerrima]|uniref:Uncharacterized protein n=1 Tax=Pistacia integerrima TaxID=434235 RepID=A0ACC0XAK7_9ROSI|nr:hypothetical protein Pint_20373 [Pistacia integerrima]
MFLNSLLSLFPILLILQLSHATQGVSAWSEASKRTFSRSPPLSPVLNAPQHYESGQLTPPPPPTHVVPSRHVHLKRRLSRERRHVSGWSHVVSKRLFPESPPPSPVANVPQHFENSQLTPPPPLPHVVPSRRVHLKRRLLGERRHVSGWSHVVSKRLFPESPPPSPVANVPQHFENSQLTPPPPPPHVVPSHRVHLKRRLLGERRHVSGWSHVVSKRLFPESPPPSPVTNVPQHFESSQLTPPPPPPHVVPSHRVHLKRRLLGERRHVSGWSHVVSKRLFPQSPPPSPVANVPQHFKNSQLTPPPPPPHVSGGSHDYEVSKRMSSRSPTPPPDRLFSLLPNSLKVHNLQSRRMCLEGLMIM